jgi:DNA-binding PadR family transcriptional regulator
VGENYYQCGRSGRKLLSVWKKWEGITISVEEVGENYYQCGRSGRELLSVWKKWEGITISVEEVGENYYQCGTLIVIPSHFFHTDSNSLPLLPH